MSEVEQQEGQKTVVAFIAGLLIGGLLVWVFSAPEGATTPTPVDEEQKVSEETKEVSKEASEETSSVTETTTEKMVVVDSEGELTVNNQPAGNVVALDGAKFPTTEGWVAIRDYSNETVGGILGAARYSQEQGLIPTEVELLRATESGVTYAAVFFTEDGSVNDAGKLYFDPKGDQQIDGEVEVFTAQ